MVLQKLRKHHLHTHVRWVVFGDEWMTGDLTGSDPLIRINFQHGLQELDTVFSLSFVVCLLKHLVEETTVKSSISQVILMVKKRRWIIVTMKVTSHLRPSDHQQIETRSPHRLSERYDHKIPQVSKTKVQRV